MNDRDLIRKAMSILGSRSSAKKREAARKNGRLGGRPKKTVDKKLTVR